MDTIMDRKLERLREDVREENRVLVEQLEGRVFDLEKENDILREKVRQLSSHYNEFKTVNTQLEEKLNDIEQQGRKNSVRIVGLEDNDRETFVRKSLDVDIDPGDIDIAHRLGHFSKDRPRSVICKITHRRKKTAILNNRRKLRGKKQVVFEDLTQKNQEILREDYRLKTVKHSYSLDGKLFVILTNDKKTQNWN